jgi:hypothetical protein
MCAGVGSLRERAGMEERFREFEARLARAERRDRATRWSGLVLLLTTLAFMGARPATPQDKDGLKPARFSAVEIQKPPRAPHALTIRLPGTGRAIGLYPSPTALDPRTYFNDAGMLYTNGWIVISGVYSGTGEGFNIEHPTKDNSMLAIWSDVHGPAIQVRAANAGPVRAIFPGVGPESELHVQRRAERRAAVGCGLAGGYGHEPLPQCVQDAADGRLPERARPAPSGSPGDCLDLPRRRLPVPPANRRPR